MKRIVNQRDNRIEYVFPEKELRDKLGIPEEMRGGVSYSTAHHTLKIFCKLPEGERND